MYFKMGVFFIGFYGYILLLDRVGLLIDIYSVMEIFMWHGCMAQDLSTSGHSF